MGFTGLTEPLTYEWTVNGTVMSTSATLSYQNAGSSFTIALGVHDANGKYAWDDHVVDVSPSNSRCLDY